jgi:hypothetical protein
MNEERPEKYLPQVEEEFEDTKGVIRIRMSRRIDNTMATRKRTNNNIHIKLKIE